MSALAKRLPDVPSLPSSAVQFDLIENGKSFAALKANWDHLALRSRFPTPFQLFGYSHAWWKAYRDEVELKLVLGTALGEVRCIAPFGAKKRSPTVWSALGTDGADYLDLIVARDDQAAQEQFRTWIHRSKIWTSIDWHDLTDESSLRSFPTIPALTKRGVLLRVKRAMQQPFPLSLSIGPSYHAYMTAQDVAEKRDVLKHRSHTKHANWLARQGKLEYTQLRATKEILKALPALIEMHQRKWAAKQSQSFYKDARVVRFTELLIEELAEHNCLRMDFLTLSGRPIAAHLGFQFQGRLYWYVTAYEPEYHSHSPGKLLIGNVLARAAQEGIAEIDFLRGTESYKEHYGSGRRTVFGLRQYRSRITYISDAVKRHLFSR